MVWVKRIRRTYFKKKKNVDTFLYIGMKMNKRKKPKKKKKKIMQKL